jgi:hypothetical protein
MRLVTYGYQRAKCFKFYSLKVSEALLAFITINTAPKKRHSHTRTCLFFYKRAKHIFLFKSYSLRENLYNGVLEPAFFVYLYDV